MRQYGGSFFGADECIRRWPIHTAIYRRGFPRNNRPQLLGHLDGMPGKGWRPVSRLE
jgi:hypothetical protein